jgi:hypothetical protein
MSNSAEYRHLVEEGADFNDVGLAELREHMTREDVKRAVFWLERRADIEVRNAAALGDWFSGLFSRWKEETGWSVDPTLLNGYGDVERLVGCWSRHLKAQARALADWDFDKACAERNRRIGDGPAKLHRD